MTEKCLTIEAMEKCPCVFCKTRREINDLIIKLYAQEELRKIAYEAMKEEEKKE